MHDLRILKHPPEAGSIFRRGLQRFKGFQARQAETIMTCVFASVVRAPLSR